MQRTERRRPTEKFLESHGVQLVLPPVVAVSSVLDHYVAPSQLSLQDVAVRNALNLINRRHVVNALLRTGAYTVASYAQEVGEDLTTVRQRLEDWVSSGSAIRVDIEGESVFPRFQFGDQLLPVPAIAHVEKATSEVVWEPLSKWRFWVEPNELLENLPPTSCLDQSEKIVAAALARWQMHIGP